ncbi:DUF6688 family protein [Aeoliella mucimassa]|uniref:DUF6688 domain-containing protein n=1 Tax=Aeoliella mucimassa TaxID=2527972 RepID=A0A518AUP8_9BACT|nr:DUF6688 family protein [Aeoliella mucimassa]QDU58451.1 hypothetical protein Pan181_46870 [Aeoliella mucimassa]
MSNTPRNTSSDPPETDSDQEVQATPSVHPSVYDDLFRKSWFVLWGMVAPVGFLFAAGGYGGIDMWQSGQFGVYCILLYEFAAMIWVYPLIAFSTAGLAYQTFRDREQPVPLWVSIAVLTGAFLWLELYVVWCGGVGYEMEGPATWVFTTLFTCPLVGVIGIQPLIALGVIAKGSQATEDANALKWYTVVLVLSGIGMLVGFFVVLFACAFCAAPLALVTYLYASKEILKSLGARWRVSISTLLLVFTWLSANFAAWRLAVLAAIESYNRLPTEPPSGCFIVTASAHGHRTLVGSQDMGHAFPVTRQLQRLKAAEILLATTLPGTHRGLRKVYDCVGPPLARMICNRWLADLSYLMLKPLEWAMLGLLRVARVPSNTITAVYRSSHCK